MLDIILSIKEEGMLNIKTMSVQAWCKHLLKVQVTHTEPDYHSALVPCRVERLAPGIDWGRSWLAICMPGLTPEMHSFLWKMLHCILPRFQVWRPFCSNLPNSSDTVTTLDLQTLHKKLLLAICSCKCGTERSDTQEIKIHSGCM